MDFQTKITIKEIILKGNFSQEWIDEFKDSELISISLKAKGKTFDCQVDNYESKTNQTIVNLQKD